jgi:hypothetical protein
MASDAALSRRCDGLALELGHFWTFDDHVHNYAMTSTYRITSHLVLLPWIHTSHCLFSYKVYTMCIAQP